MYAANKKYAYADTAAARSIAASVLELAQAACWSSIAPAGVKRRLGKSTNTLAPRASHEWIDQHEIGSLVNFVPSNFLLRAVELLS